MANVSTGAGSIAASGAEIVMVTVAGVSVVLFLYWMAKREVKGAVTAVADTAVSAAKAVGTAVNPVSHENIANKATNAVVKAVTMDDSATLGTWLYEVLNKDKEAALAKQMGWK